MIGVSGGKDSTKQAVTARDELGLNCLLVNYQPENITELGRKNLENLKSLGFDLISIRPNPKIMMKVTKHDFFNYLNFVKASEFPLYASTYIIAEKFKIPLIIQGENPGLTVGTSLTGVGTDSDALKAYQLQTLSGGIQEYLDVDDVTQKDLYFFHYDVQKLLDLNVKGIWIQYYLKEWSSTGNAEFSKKYGFQERENIKPEEIGYINAHGTSTPAGDVVEVRAVKKTFSKHANNLVINSTKSMIGHLLGAAGGVEAIVSILSLQHQKVHPTINIFNQDPECDLDFNASESREIDIKYALSNSFGFGGTNGSLIFSKYD